MDRHSEPPDEARPLLARLGWMLLIWTGSVSAFAAVAFAIRMILTH